ncbi:response regulator transcription factor [Streptomyces natalensis]|uniref:response regulator transcription factor n=1 Tax=Streptomyces natalensis TaxID=68242 RepID=UPI000AB3F85C|nr:response regulator transcription factor [Streptomyces natalensis]
MKADALLRRTSRGQLPTKFRFGHAAETTEAGAHVVGSSADLNGTDAAIAVDQPSLSGEGAVEVALADRTPPRNRTHTVVHAQCPRRAFGRWSITGKGRTALYETSTNTEKVHREHGQRDTAQLWRPPTPGDPDAIIALTPREREVLLLLSGAASNRDIGRTLNIAERTVKAHLTSIMTKISVSSRTEAALFAYAHHRHIVRCDRPGTTR